MFHRHEVPSAGTRSGTTCAGSRGDVGQHLAETWREARRWVVGAFRIVSAETPIR